MVPEDLVMALLQKAVVNLRRAQADIEQMDYNDANAVIIHTQEILLELEGMIRSDDPSSDNAKKVLDLLEESLFFANINKDSGALDEAANVIQRLINISFFSKLQP